VAENTHLSQTWVCRGDAMENRVRDTNSYSGKECSKKNKKGKLFCNIDNIIIIVSKEEKNEYVNIKISYSVKIKNKLLLLVLILLFLYLCYRLGLIDAIENIVGNLIVALIIFLKRGHAT
jgi:hypothetical protein